MIDHVALGCIATGTGTRVNTFLTYACHVRRALSADGAFRATVGWYTYVLR